jgi:hypothetical protein
MTPATTTNARGVTLPAWNIAPQVAFMLRREDTTKALVNVELLQVRVCAEDVWEHEGNVAR